PDYSAREVLGASSSSGSSTFVDIALWPRNSPPGSMCSAAVVISPQTLPVGEISSCSTAVTSPLTAPEICTFLALMVAMTRPDPPTIRFPRISISPSTEPSIRILPSDLSVPTKLVPGPTTVSGLPLSAGGGPACDFLVPLNIGPPMAPRRWDAGCVAYWVSSHLRPSAALIQLYNCRAAII